MSGRGPKPTSNLTSMLVALAAVATIIGTAVVVYQVFFQTSAQVVVKLPDQPGQGVAKPSDVKSVISSYSSAVALLPNFVAANGNFSLASIGLAVDGEKLSSLEDLALSAWFLESGRLLSFASKKAAFLSGNNYQDFNVSNAARISNQLLLCISYVAGGHAISRVEMRDISDLKANTAVVSSSNGAQLHKPVVRTKPPFDCASNETAAAAVAALTKQ